MKEFVTLKGFNNIENDLFRIKFFDRMDDNDQHFGDKLFLSKITERLSIATSAQNDRVKECDICITLPRRLSSESGPSIGIDWSAKKYLPAEINLSELANHDTALIQQLTKRGGVMSHPFDTLSKICVLGLG